MVGMVVQRGCAKWRARVVRNWLLIHISRADEVLIETDRVFSWRPPMLATESVVSITYNCFAIEKRRRAYSNNLNMY